MAMYIIVYVPAMDMLSAVESISHSTEGSISSVAEHHERAVMSLHVSPTVYSVILDSLSAMVGAVVSAGETKGGKIN